MAKKRKTNNPHRSRSTARRARRVAREEARARRSVSSATRASWRDELRDKRRLAQSPSSVARASGRALTRRHVWGGLALGLAVGVCYLPAMLWGGFVWDDRVFTEAEPVRDGIGGLWRIWFSPSDITSEGHYWPLTYTTFWLEHELWGFDPTGYHIVNVVLHLANTLLLWGLLARLTVPGAWVVAAVFAVHPLHVESVAWVIERKDVLSGAFYLTAFLAYLRFATARVNSLKGACETRWRPYFLALALFVLGMLCKSIVVTLPVALLICHWWQQGRVTGAEVLGLTPFFAVGLGMVIADLSYYKEAIAMDYALLERVIIAARVLWFYVGKLLCPVRLAVIYPHWAVEVADPLAWSYVATGVALLALLYRYRHRIGRGPLSGALFFAVTLSPVLGFIDFGYMQFSFVADRYQYLAGIGVLAVIVSAAVHYAGRLPGAWQRVVLLIALATMGVLTWRHASIYRDELTFFNHVIAHNPTARNAHLNLGKALFEAGRREDGLAAIQIAVAQRPTSFKAQLSAGLMLMHLSRFDASADHLRRAIELNPNHRDAHYSAGMVFANLGRIDDAEHHYLRAVEIDPSHFEALTNLGAMLIGAGRFEDAASHLHRALGINPRDSKALHTLALAHLRQQHYAKALALYQRVVKLMPDNARAYADMGIALYYLGRADEALTNLDRALSLDPTLEDARVNREAIQQVKNNP